MREGLTGDAPGGMAYPFLPQRDLAASAEMLPLHAELFPIRAGGLPHPRVLERQRADIVAHFEVSAVLPRRLGSCSAAEKEKN